jgi:hypothetical protein
LPSIGDIADVIANSCSEDAIIIAKSETTLLDDISLEGDVPDDISDSGEDRQKDMFTENSTS